MINEGDLGESQEGTFKLFLMFLHSHLLRQAVPQLYKLYITWAKAFWGFLNYTDKSNVAAGRENEEKLSNLVMDKISFSNFTIHRYKAAKDKQSNKISNKLWCSYRLSETYTAAIKKPLYIHLFYLKKWIFHPIWKINIMQPSKEFQGKMRVINAINEFEKGISKALALLWTTGRAIIPQRWEESAPNSAEQWRAYQNVSKSTLMIHPGGQKSTQKKKCRPHLPQLQSVFRMNNEKVTRQKQPPQESSEAKANADQKDCKSSSNLCWKHLNKPQKVLCLLPKVDVFGPYIPPKRKKKNTTVFQYKNIIPWLKYGGGGGGMVWACFSASGPEKNTWTDHTALTILYLDH